MYGNVWDGHRAVPFAPFYYGTYLCSQPLSYLWFVNTMHGNYNIVQHHCHHLGSPDTFWKETVQQWSEMCLWHFSKSYISWWWCDEYFQNLRRNKRKIMSNFIQFDSSRIRSQFCYVECSNTVFNNTSPSMASVYPSYTHVIILVLWYLLGYYFFFSSTSFVSNQFSRFMWNWLLTNYIHRQKLQKKLRTLDHFFFVKNRWRSENRFRNVPAFRAIVKRFTLTINPIYLPQMQNHANCKLMITCRWTREHLDKIPTLVKLCHAVLIM